MRAFAGFLFLSAGLGVGAYTCFPETLAFLPTLPDWASPGLRISMALAGDRNGDRRAATEPETTASRPAESQGPRVFSPQSPLFAPVIDARPVRPASAQPVAPAATHTAPAPASPSTASVVVTVADNTAPPQPVTRPVLDWATTVTRNAAKSVHRGSSKPSDPDARADLVRDIQTHLKRLGCYDGDVDGSWGPASRRAMGSFTERINASLPTDEPDYILLTLVAGHRGVACGNTCPAGQSLDDGRCVPTTVVAGAARRAQNKDVAVRNSPIAATVATVEDIVTGSIAAPASGQPEPAKTAVVTPSPTAKALKDPEPARTATAPAQTATRSEKPVRTIAEVISDDKGPKRVTEQPAPAATASLAKPLDHKADQPVAATLQSPSKTATTHVAVTRRHPVARHEPAPAAVASIERPRVEPLPGRMTIGGPVPEQAQPAAPVTEPRHAEDDEPSKVQRSHTRPKHRPYVVHSPRPVHAPAPRVVRSPPPRHVARPRYASASSSGSGSSAAARQRAMVYNLFQRPDRY